MFNHDLYWSSKTSESSATEDPCIEPINRSASRGTGREKKKRETEREREGERERMGDGESGY